MVFSALAILAMAAPVPMPAWKLRGKTSLSQLIEEHEDESGAAYLEKTWSLHKSNHGRFSTCHSGYGGSCTNANMETTWKDKSESIASYICF